MRTIIVLSVLVLFLSGCATTSQITPKISLGMTKQEVLGVCGKPYKSGAFTDPKTGKVIEALTYREFVYSNPLGLDSNYRDMHIKIYFKDNKVVQYGEGLDWETLSDFEGERKIKITTDENIKLDEKK